MKSPHSLHIFKRLRQETLPALAAVLWLVSATINLPAAESGSLPRLDEALKNATTFEYGKNASSLQAIETIVVESVKNPSQRGAVEQRLVQALSSASTRDAKEFLCRQLFIIGTAQSVPALETLLADPELSHVARYALGRMADPASDAALHRALNKTTGNLQAGLLDTLADRRYAQALPDFVKLLKSPDLTVAMAAVRALGTIGGADAVAALASASSTATEPLRLRIEDALLVCADNFLRANQEAQALRIYRSLEAPDQPKYLRIAALRGLSETRSVEAVALLVEAIKGTDADLRVSAIGLVPTARGPNATQTFASVLPTLPPATQELLLNSLGRRGDTAAAPAAIAALKSSQEPVRAAACEALGTLGDASTVNPLLQAAATGGSTEQTAARASLVKRRGRDFDEALRSGLRGSDPKVQAEAARALAGRHTTSAISEILEVAKSNQAATRREAIRALGLLVSENELASLVGLLIHPLDAADRAPIEQAIETAFRRIPDPAKQANPLLAAFKDAPADAKSGLLRLLGRPATPEALDTVRSALKDANAAVQETAIRTLADWPDAMPADDLLASIRSQSNPTLKVIALRGYVRMAGLSKDPTAMYKRAMELAPRVDDKKMVLGGLASANSTAALTLVEPYLKDESLQAEAALAAIQIASRLRDTDAPRAKAALINVRTTASNPPIRQQAQEAINQMEQFEGYLRSWLGAGPYQEKGKDARALFNIAFAPEQSAASDVKWTPIVRGLGSWEINLSEAVTNADNCVAYLRTRVWAPATQAARLELSSDDSIKAWLNGKLVHAHDTDRGMTPREDVVKVTLQEGWNDIQLKIVNNSGGWGAACRVRQADGSAIAGLKVEAQ